MAVSERDRMPACPATGSHASGREMVTAVRLGLADRGLDSMVAVSHTLGAHPADAVPTAPPYSGRGRRYGVK
jgi:hypothetical protein